MSREEFRIVESALVIGDYGEVTDDIMASRSPVSFIPLICKREIFDSGDVLDTRQSCNENSRFRDGGKLRFTERTSRLLQLVARIGGLRQASCVSQT